MRFLRRILRNRKNRKDFDSIRRHDAMRAAFSRKATPYGRNNPAVAPGADPQEVTHARNKNHRR